MLQSSEAYVMYKAYAHDRLESTVPPRRDPSYMSSTVGRVALDRDDHLAQRVPLVDTAERLDHLAQRVAPIDDRR